MGMAKNVGPSSWPKHGPHLGEHVQGGWNEDHERQRR